MTDAFVHISAESTSVLHAAREVAEIEEVTSAHVVTGEYDVIAQIELNDLDDLPHVVAEKIQNAPPVEGTVTSVAYEAE
ncbi:Lrp/AsnC family transcriptional regulator [Haladaptatus cibarius]|uniref:Lrp/AsnC family transcriptional regulator n=1 Tax=Haladaptatus cibarius TaxID=453847 RepID=UPI0006791A8C|nr:Lrp/AsnC ligand binding domain-containing protein [Haladaptatus cibarius]